MALPAAEIVVEETEREDYFDEHVLNNLELHAGSALDTAQQYMEDF